MNLHKIAPKAYEPMMGLEKFVEESGLDKTLYHLIKTRASQINACHFCIKMHTRDAIKLGETPQRLFLLDAWWEVPKLYSEKEQAVLALTEATTLIADAGVPDEVYENAANHLDEKELATVIMGIVAINAWNRIAITTKMPLD